MTDTHMHPLRLLTINTGSSSLKAARYVTDGPEGAVRRSFRATAERIGASGTGEGDGHLRVIGAEGESLLDVDGDYPDHAGALAALFAWMRTQGDAAALDAVGHRVVHGGPHYREPHVISEAMLAALRDLVPIDPDHLPQAIALIEAVTKAHPGLPQVACFDTAFHRHMPAVARAYPLPPEYADAGVMRYGFHGLSYEYIIGALQAIDATAARGRVVIAHLGNGASMAAVRGGVGIETTMGFSPTGGIMMGTRTGDLDPGVLLYLLGARGMSAADVSTLVNKGAGLRGVSGTSADMRDLLAAAVTDPHAAAAVDLFCYTAKKALGALVAVLGGLDTLVFTGGIGEHAAPVRARITAGLDYLGLHVDAQRNAAHDGVISTDDSAVTVRVMPTDEDLMIARHTAQLMQSV